MEYLLEIQWSDPVAAALVSVLSTLPTDVEPRTAAIPPDTPRGFVVLAAPDREEMERLAQAITAAGATVRVVAGGEPRAA